MTDRAMTPDELHELMEDLAQWADLPTDTPTDTTPDQGATTQRTPGSWTPQGYVPAPMRLTQRELEARPGEAWSPTGRLLREFLDLLGGSSRSRRSAPPRQAQPSRVGSRQSLEASLSSTETEDQGREP